MILSRAKPAVDVQNTGRSQSKNKILSFNEFLEKRDYTGAMTLLEFSKGVGDDVLRELWLGFCAFHLGDYKKALTLYESVLKKDPIVPDIQLNIAVCYFYLGMYKESTKLAQDLPSGPLRTRLLFHLAHKLGDEAMVMEHHKNLKDVIEDQLSLASLHYLRSHYQEAIDIYKGVLLDNRDLLALKVYIALCYYKLDYFDISQEVLNVYLSTYSDSTIAGNLRACNFYRLDNLKAAENELKALSDRNIFGSDLVKHNLVVFRNGEGAMQVLPGLVDIIPEARLNLVIQHLRNNEVSQAYALICNLEPTVPQEYILKGVVNVEMGQLQGSKEHIQTGIQCLQLVGDSASECNTVPGRESMASVFFLYGQFEEVLVYLNSIKSHYINDDTFNYNYAQAKTATGFYKEAIEKFNQITNQDIRYEYTYICCLCRCYIKTNQPEKAWELYVTMKSGPESFNVLVLIANDCYKMGHFWYSAKSFDILDRMDPSPEYWEGKRGACIGVLQLIAAHDKRATVEQLGGVLGLLRNTHNPQADAIAKIMRRYAKESNITLN